ncbi:DNA internalization-related competence protein ComEC/Rec2 [Natranaerobius thermophilus]|uniref:DNA internalization-related competence protein ComEC/Rec2 n=1 Tax=Natranaerobius thermophilus (strain ATCC BAA-1301 / DSM 18059 / JW/NM-WN-LF) TaxID=457570 RepID=B2A1L6_NATTJ|nr:DNA internalization-related competence protein ComEC/Rec2 [Natranaerobius thermophilus]ACB84756.1 DNA internalization-related competence protein ComEC/Rec2 [Natranaerobius thermophilus JW/NM-WN-LF]
MGLFLIFCINLISIWYWNRQLLPLYIGTDSQNSYDVEFIGKISGSPSTGANSIHYPVTITELSFVEQIDQLQQIEQVDQTFNSPLKVRMSLPKKDVDEQRELLPGNRVRGRANMVKPEGARNPGGFDYASYLKSRGKFHILYPQNPHNLEIIGESISLHRPGTLLSNNLTEIYLKNLDLEVSPWVIALTLGDLSYLNKQSITILDEAGARYLTAVSGLHMKIVALSLYNALLAIGIRKKCSVIVTLIVSLIYASAAGFSPSVMRAMLMLGLVLCSSLTTQKLSPLLALSLSLLVILAFSPFLIFNVGLQLSFIATLFIILIYPELKSTRNSITSFLIEPFKIALCAQLGVFPLILHHFGWVSFGSLLLAPFLAMVLAPLILAAMIFGLLVNLDLAFIPIQFLKVFIELTVRYLQTVIYLVAQYSFSLWGHWSGVQLVCYYISILVILIFKNSPLIIRPVKYLPLLAIFSMICLFISFLSPFNKTLDTYYLDVGQGNSAVIFTPKGQTILIDSGGVPLDSRFSDPGETVLLPFLRYYGEKTIDLVIITHAHTDHFAGLIAILDHVNISQVLIPELGNDTEEFEKLMEQLNNRNIPVNYVQDPGVIDLGSDATMEILHPNSPYLTGTNCDLNNNSIVTRLVWQETALFFPGDLEEEGERRLLNTISEDNLNSQVLKVPHHGSSTSSSLQFLEAIDPSVAIISVGNNSYGHPSLQLIEELESSGIRVFRTDKNGAVILNSNGRELQIKSYIEN